MTPPSRRQLAAYAVEAILDGQPAAKLGCQLAAALIAGGQQNETEWLLADIEQELESRGLYARASVTTAHELPAKLQAALAQQIKQATKVKDVSVDQIIDKDVIGGLRIETASRTWDNTIARELAELKGGI